MHVSGFMSYLVFNIGVIAYLMIYACPRWGEKTPVVYIAICSLLGSFVVVILQVVGSAIVYSVENPHDSQLKDWTLYLLIACVCFCGVTQINYLNKALNIFSTAIVTPIYFVCFTTATLVCSAVLFRDFAFTSGVQLVSALVGFLVIVGGVALLFAYNSKLSKSTEKVGSILVPHGPRTPSNDSSGSSSPNMSESLLSPNFYHSGGNTGVGEAIGLSRLRISTASQHSNIAGNPAPRGTPTQRTFWGESGEDVAHAVVVSPQQHVGPVGVLAAGMVASPMNAGPRSYHTQHVEGGGGGSGGVFKLPTVKRGERDVGLLEDVGPSGGGWDDEL
ncbi:hypothetical protein HDU98_008261 [Podochytrium sp. JEL0797]|nr:hypothetical protein HDU98_008261 [Podochytrium sp. JEL0797]